MDSQVRVWDPFVRLFHWALVPLFLVAYLTGDDKGQLHRYVGYTILGLVIARIFWGLVGTEYSRFNNFVCSPAKALTYLKDLPSGRSIRYTGHNPAAAWMIIFLLFNTIVICLSGYVAYTAKVEDHSSGAIDNFLLVGTAYADDDNDKEDDDHERNTGNHDKKNESGRGDNSEKEDSDGDSIWSDIHEISAQLMLVLILLHIFGVAASSKMHNENLLKAMFTGKKDNPAI